MHEARNSVVAIDDALEVGAKDKQVAANLRQSVARAEEGASKAAINALKEQEAIHVHGMV